MFSLIYLIVSTVLKCFCFFVRLFVFTAILESTLEKGTLFLLRLEFDMRLLTAMVFWFCFTFPCHSVPSWCILKLELVPGSRSEEGDGKSRRATSGPRAWNRL